jgi:hypothetical protein
MLYRLGECAAVVERMSGMLRAPVIEQALVSIILPSCFSGLTRSGIDHLSVYCHNDAIDGFQSNNLYGMIYYLLSEVVHCQNLTKVKCDILQ